MHARLAVIVCTALFAAGCSQSPSGGGATSGTVPQSAQTTMDQRFAAEAASMGLNEVAVGQMAAERGATPEIRAFGQHLAQEHGRNNDRLMGAAKQAGVAVPTRPDSEEIAKMDKLDDLTGPAFDRAFVNQMVADHQEAVRLFQQQANQGSAPSLRSYASQTLPRLQDHLAQAQALARRQGS